MRVVLETGELEFLALRCTYPVHTLTGFAARNNPRRGFLFVSKVLGKHWPVRPSMMQHTHAELAAQLATCFVQGPVFVVGMAETATALGRGVFESLCAVTGLTGIYSHTTRYRVQRCGALCFSEEHCHASQHWLHLPEEPAAQEIVRTARSLILVDDEMSTGKTFCNMVAVLRQKMPCLEQVFVVTLMDMAGDEGRQRVRQGMPCSTHFVSLLEGSFTFRPRPDFHFGTAPKSVGDGANKDLLLPHTGGRTGVWPGQGDSVLRMDTALLREGSVLVLGTGEFMYEPYRLALDWEKAGREVYFQATTRSPILPGNDIASAITFVDNYGENIDNFLYNVQDKGYDNIVLCYETACLPPQHDLPSRLGAHCCRVLPPHGAGQ